jgi:hypothetical protein
MQEYCARNVDTSASESLAFIPFQNHGSCLRYCAQRPQCTFATHVDIFCELFQGPLVPFLAPGAGTVKNVIVKRPACSFEPQDI